MYVYPSMQPPGFNTDHIQVGGPPLRCPAQMREYREKHRSAEAESSRLRGEIGTLRRALEARPLSKLASTPKTDAGRSICLKKGTDLAGLCLGCTLTSAVEGQI